MAWQLIYTSAPRLIEAGRTGFGTVARHRAVSGMLASAVERFSQFARLPGHDPRRVVHAHRILTVGSGTYHVLSCLQDAGSDYTGRTNHIAHHLIAEPREIRALSAAGLTPADVLLSMAWRTSWNEGPRYLDPSEEVNLSSFTPAASHAWASVTGNPATAGILWSREAQRGCYLITPSGINVLELFRESLQVESAHAWQTRFTTCLEPNDDVTDFRWIALSSSSPMRGQVETTNRLVLDLTRPDTLPAPPPPEVAQPSSEPAITAAPEPAHSAQAPVHETMRSSGAASAPVSPMGAWSPEPRRKAAKSNRSFIGISLIIAAVMTVVVVGALLRQNNLKEQARADYEQKIAATWKNHQLVLNDTRKLLEEQPDIEEGTALLKSHEDFFRSMKQLLKQPGTSIELPLPSHTADDLEDLKKLLEEWAELHVKPWAKLQSGQTTVTASDILEAYRKWQDSRNATWKQLSHSLSLKEIPPPGEEVVQSLKDAAREVLRQSEPARDSRAQWEEVFKLPGDPKNSTVLEVQQWLKLWSALNDAGPQSHATAQTAASNHSLPEWLREKAAGMKQQPDKKNEPKMAVKTDEPRTQVAPQPVVIIDDADAISATNPIFLCLLQPNEDPAGKIAGLKVSDDMQLFVGSAWASHSPPDGKTEPKEGELKKWLGASSDGREKLKFGPSIVQKLTDLIVFSKDGVLTAIPEELRNSPDGIRIVARSEDGLQVLFDLRLIPISSASSRPMLTQAFEATVINAATVTLTLPVGFLSRLHIVGQQEVGYVLRHDGPANQKKFFTLKSMGNSAFQVIPPNIQTGSMLNVREIEKEIKELEAGIAKDVADLAENEKSTVSPAQKAERKERSEKGKAAKELKLQELQTKLQNLNGNAPPPFDLLPGNFILALEQPNKIELCKLKVVLPSGHSQSKPINP
ncbi:MAG: hypothetical protein WAW39_27015 [Prosthecobacter sp.]|uniref:GAP1-N2 domain-containing protein n=1 Tax=Prosthecobacter sp. TaxID=1965333 RepID=UPI003BAF329B